MLNEPHPVSIRFSDEFEENLYVLSKKYRHIRSDIQRSAIAPSPIPPKQFSS